MTNTNNTDVIERLEKRARLIVKLEKEIQDKEDNIKMMQHKIDFMKNAMDFK